ncbi:MAG: tetratricopeptide repeat protein [Mucilaginibacter polytrichastri]|nr:tetratricopeptide repeat protein [Mucilaginibacter polytrichastri]
MHTDRLARLLEFIETEPNDPFLKYALATEYLRLNDEKKALDYFQNLVEQHPDYVGTYYHLGKLYERLGQKDDAVFTYKKGMEIAQAAGDQHARNELMGALNQLQDMDFDD